MDLLTLITGITVVSQEVKNGEDKVGLHVVEDEDDESCWPARGYLGVGDPGYQVCGCCHDGMFWDLTFSFMCCGTTALWTSWSCCCREEVCMGCCCEEKIDLKFIYHYQSDGKHRAKNNGEKVITTTTKTKNEVFSLSEAGLNAKCCRKEKNLNYVYKRLKLSQELCPYPDHFEVYDARDCKGELATCIEDELKEDDLIYWLKWDGDASLKEIISPYFKAGSKQFMVKILCGDGPLVVEREG